MYLSHITSIWQHFTIPASGLFLIELFIISDKIEVPLYSSPKPFYTLSSKASTTMNFVCNFPLGLYFYYIWTHTNTEYCFDFLKCTCVVLDCTYSVTCFVFPLWYVFILSYHVDKCKSCSFILIAIL